MGPKVQKYKYFTKYVEHVFLMIDLFGRFLIQNWHVSYFLSISLLFVVTSVLESGVHCHFKLFFISNFYNFFWKCCPTSTTTCTESWQLLLNIHCKKCEYRLWKYYALLLFIFLQRRSYKTFQRIIQTKIKSMAIFKWHRSKEENMLICCRSYRNKL